MCVRMCVCIYIYIYIYSYLFFTLELSCYLGLKMLLRNMQLNTIYN